MPTALAEWTPERPTEPGYYWCLLPDYEPMIADVRVMHDDDTAPEGALWWPVRLEAPPVG